MIKAAGGKKVRGATSGK